MAYEKEFLEIFGALMSQEFSKSAPKDTSLLANSFFNTMRIEGNTIKWSLPEYAEYVEFGTGIYGPKGKPIVPKEKKALAFKYKGNNVVVKSIKGQRANPFIRHTFNRKSGEIFKQALEIWKERISS